MTFKSSNGHHMATSSCWFSCHLSATQTAGQRLSSRLPVVPKQVYRASNSSYVFLRLTSGPLVPRDVAPLDGNRVGFGADVNVGAGANTSQQAPPLGTVSAPRHSKGFKRSLTFGSFRVGPDVELKITPITSIVYSVLSSHPF